MSPQYDWKVPTASPSTGSRMPSQRQFSELTALLDQARQELGALDSKWTRANDAALIQKILTDRTVFTGSNPVRRHVERLGSLASSLFGSPSIAPAPVTPPPMPTQPGRAPTPTRAPTPPGATTGWDAWAKEQQYPADLISRVGAGGSSTPFDNPPSRMYRESGRDPETGEPLAGYEWQNTPRTQPFGWLSQEQMNPYQQGLYREWESNPTSRQVVPSGSPQMPGQTWTGSQYSDSPAPEQPTGGDVQPGFREVDEDTGIEYEFLGGNAGDENAWRPV